MPLDRIVGIGSLGDNLNPGSGAEWRSFGPDLINGRDIPEFSNEGERPLFRIFACDTALLEAWLDTQGDDPYYPELRARRLSVEVEQAAGDALAASMVGANLQVRGQVYGIVTAATFVRRTQDLNTSRAGYSRWDLTMDRDMPRGTCWRFEGDLATGGPVEISQLDPEYVWCYLDRVWLRQGTFRQVWGEFLDLRSEDRFTVGDDNLESASRAVTAEVRVRFDPRIDTDSVFTIEGRSFEVQSVREDLQRPRQRFQVVDLARLTT